VFSFPFGSLISASSVTALTNCTLRFIVKTPATFGGGEIFGAQGSASSGEDCSIYYTNTGSNVLAIQKPCGTHDDPYIWTVPLSPSTWYDIAIALQWNNSSAPVVYANGVALTVTLYQTGDSTDTMKTDVWTLGGGTTGAGYIGGFAWYNAQLSATTMKLLTARRKYDAPLDFPTNLVQYIPMDDFPVGEYTASNTNITPSADVANTFGSGNFSSIASDDGSYLSAGSSDDNETYTCELTTFTVPSGYSAFATTQSIKGNTDDTENPSASVTINAVEQTVWGQSFSGSDAISTRSDYLALSQSDIDGMRLNLKTPSISKDGGINWNHCFVKISYRRHPIRNLRGSIEFRNVGGTVQSVGISGGGFSYA